MIKWIGQHIWDFVSRFRNDVYLENIADGTVDSDKFLGLDSNNKIVKETVSAGVTISDSTANTGFPVVFHDESNNLHDDTGAFVYNPSNGNLAVPGDLTGIAGGTFSITANLSTDIQVGSKGNMGFAIDIDNNETSQEFGWYANAIHGSQKIMSLSETAKLQVGDYFSPGTVVIHNQVDDANSGELKFETQRGGTAADAQDDDAMGKISFHGYDDGTPSVQQYGEVTCIASDVTSGQEAGAMIFKVAEFDGTVTQGLKLEGNTDANGGVHVNIGGDGAASVTTVAGKLKCAQNSFEFFLDGTTDPTLSMMSAEDTGDKFEIVTTTHGATTLTTTDDDATAAHFEVAADGNITLDAAGGIGLKAGSGVVTGDAAAYQFNSSSTSRPSFSLVNNTDDATGPTIQLTNLRDGNGLEDGDILGNIIFDGGDVAGQFEGYASIVASVVEADNGDEAGQVAIQVANDGTPRNGIVVTADKATAEEVDVTIANGVASTTTIAGGLLVNGSNNIFTSATSAKPAVKLTNSNTDALGPEIIFEKTATGADSDDLGKISFIGDNDNDEVTSFATIYAEIADASDSDEAGRLSMTVMASDGSFNHSLPAHQGRNAFTATGHGTNDIVDVTLGYGTASTTTIAGDFTVTSKASIPRRKFAIPSDGAGNADGDVVYVGSNSSDGGTPAVLTAGKIYYFHSGDDATNGSWTATNSNDPGTATGLIGVALGATPATDGVLLRGMVDLADDIVGTEVFGSILYLDKATAGAATTAAPTDTGDIVRVIGYSVQKGNVNKIWFNPDNTWVEHV